MTTTVTELDLTVLEDLEFSPSCDGAWDDCLSGESPKWIGTLKCCGKIRLFCDDCRLRIISFNDTVARIHPTDPWLHCRFCKNIWDASKGVSILFTPLGS